MFIRIPSSSSCKEKPITSYYYLLLKRCLVIAVIVDVPSNKKDISFSQVYSHLFASFATHYVYTMHNIIAAYKNTQRWVDVDAQPGTGETKYC